MVARHLCKYTMRQVKVDSSTMLAAHLLSVQCPSTIYNMVEHSVYDAVFAVIRHSTPPLALLRPLCLPRAISCAAAAIVALRAVPSKLGPLIKALMNSIKVWQSACLTR